MEDPNRPAGIDPTEERSLADLPPRSAETADQALTEQEPIDPDEGRSGTEIATHDLTLPPVSQIGPKIGPG